MRRYLRIVSIVDLFSLFLNILYPFFVVSRPVFAQGTCIRYDDYGKCIEYETQPPAPQPPATQPPAPQPPAEPAPTTQPKASSCATSGCTSDWNYDGRQWCENGAWVRGLRDSANCCSEQRVTANNDRCQGNKLRPKRPPAEKRPTTEATCVGCAGVNTAWRWNGKECVKREESRCSEQLIGLLGPTATDPSSCTFWCAGCEGFCGDRGVEKGLGCNAQARLYCGEKACYETGSCARCDLGQSCPDPNSQQCVSGYCVTKQPVASGGVYAPCVNPDGSGCYNNTKNTKWEDGRVLTLTPYDGSCPDEKAAINGRCWLDLGNPSYREAVGGVKERVEREFLESVSNYVLEADRQRQASERRVNEAWRAYEGCSELTNSQTAEQCRLRLGVEFELTEGEKTVFNNLVGVLERQRRVFRQTQAALNSCLQSEEQCGSYEQLKSGLAKEERDYFEQIENEARASRERIEAIVEIHLRCERQPNYESCYRQQLVEVTGVQGEELAVARVEFERFLERRSKVEGLAFFLVSGDRESLSALQTDCIGKLVSPERCGDISFLRGQALSELRVLDEEVYNQVKSAIKDQQAAEMLVANDRERLFQDCRERFSRGAYGPADTHFKRCTDLSAYRAYLLNTRVSRVYPPGTSVFNEMGRIVALYNNQEKYIEQEADRYIEITGSSESYRQLLATITTRQGECSQQLAGSFYDYGVNACVRQGVSGASEVISLGTASLPVSFLGLTGCPRIGERYDSELGTCVATKPTTLVTGSYSRIFVGPVPITFNRCQEGYRPSTSLTGWGGGSCVPELDKEINTVGNRWLVDNLALDRGVTLGSVVANTAGRVGNTYGGICQDVYNRTGQLPASWQLCSREDYRPSSETPYGRYTEAVRRNSQIEAVYLLFPERVKELVVDGELDISRLSSDELAAIDRQAVQIQGVRVVNVPTPGSGQVSAREYGVHSSWTEAAYAATGREEGGVNPYVANQVFVDSDGDGQREWVPTARAFAAEWDRQHPTQAAFFDMTLPFYLLRWWDRTFAPNSAAREYSQIVGGGANSVNALAGLAGIQFDMVNQSYQDYVFDPEKGEVYRVAFEAASRSVYDFNQEATRSVLLRAGQPLQNLGAVVVGGGVALLTGGASLAVQIPIDLAYDVITQSLLNAVTYSQRERFVDNLKDQAQAFDGQVRTVLVALTNQASRAEQRAETTEFVTLLGFDVVGNFAGQAFSNWIAGTRMVGQLSPELEVALVRSSDPEKVFSDVNGIDLAKLFTDTPNVRVYAVLEDGSLRVLQAGDDVAALGVKEIVVANQAIQVRASSILDNVNPGTRGRSFFSTDFSQQTYIRNLLSDVDPTVRVALEQTSQIQATLAGTVQSPLARLWRAITGRGRQGTETVDTAARQVQPESVARIVPQAEVPRAGEVVTDEVAIRGVGVRQFDTLGDAQRTVGTLSDQFSEGQFVSIGVGGRNRAYVIASDRSLQEVGGLPGQILANPRLPGALRDWVAVRVDATGAFHLRIPARLVSQPPAATVATVTVRGGAAEALPQNPRLARVEVDPELRRVADAVRNGDIELKEGAGIQAISVSRTTTAGEVIVTRNQLVAPAGASQELNEAVTKVNDSLNRMADYFGYESFKPGQVVDAVNIMSRNELGETLINVRGAGFGKTEIDNLVSYWHAVEQKRPVVRHLPSDAAVRDIARKLTQIGVNGENPYRDIPILEINREGNFVVINPGRTDAVTDEVVTNLRRMGELTDDGAIILTHTNQSGWAYARGKATVYGESDMSDVWRWHYENIRYGNHHLFDEAHLFADTTWTVRGESVKFSDMTPDQRAEFFFDMEAERIDDVIGEARQVAPLNDFRSSVRNACSAGYCPRNSLLTPDGRPVDTDLYRRTHLALIDQQLSATTDPVARSYLTQLRQAVDGQTDLVGFDRVLQEGMNARGVTDGSVRRALSELQVRQQTAEGVWQSWGTRVVENDLDFVDGRVVTSRRAIPTGETPASVIDQYVQEIEGRTMLRDIMGRDVPNPESVRLSDMEFSLNQTQATIGEMLHGSAQTATPERIQAATGVRLGGGEVLRPPEASATHFGQNTAETIRTTIDNTDFSGRTAFFVLGDDGVPFSRQQDEIMTALIDGGQRPQRLAVATSGQYEIYTVRYDADGNYVGTELSWFDVDKKAWEAQFLQLDENGFRLVDGTGNSVQPDSLVVISHRVEQFDPTINPDAQPIVFMSEVDGMDTLTQGANRYRGFAAQREADPVAYLTGKGYTDEQIDRILSVQPVYGVRTIDNGVVDATGRFHEANEFSGLTSDQVEGRLLELAPSQPTTLRRTIDGERIQFDYKPASGEAVAVVIRTTLTNDTVVANVFERNLLESLQQLRVRSAIRQVEIAEEQVVGDIYDQLRRQLPEGTQARSQLDELYRETLTERGRTRHLQARSYSSGVQTGQEAYYTAVADFDLRLRGFVERLRQIGGVDADQIGRELLLDQDFLSRPAFLEAFANGVRSGFTGTPRTPQEMLLSFLQQNSPETISQRYIGARQALDTVAPFTFRPPATIRVIAARTQNALIRLPVVGSILRGVGRLIGSRRRQTTVADQLYESEVTEGVVVTQRPLTAAQRIGRVWQSLADQLAFVPSILRIGQEPAAEVRERRGVLARIGEGIAGVRTGVMTRLTSLLGRSRVSEEVQVFGDELPASVQEQLFGEISGDEVDKGVSDVVAGYQQSVRAYTHDEVMWEMVTQSGRRGAYEVWTGLHLLTDQPGGVIDKNGEVLSGDNLPELYSLEINGQRRLALKRSDRSWIFTFNDRGRELTTSVSGVNLGRREVKVFEDDSTRNISVTAIDRIDEIDYDAFLGRLLSQLDELMGEELAKDAQSIVRTGVPKDAFSALRGFLVAENLFPSQSEQLAVFANNYVRATSTHPENEVMVAERFHAAWRALVAFRKLEQDKANGVGYDGNLLAAMRANNTSLAREWLEAIIRGESTGEEAMASLKDIEEKMNTVVLGKQMIDEAAIADLLVSASEELGVAVPRSDRRQSITRVSWFKGSFNGFSDWLKSKRLERVGRDLWQGGVVDVFRYGGEAGKVRRAVDEQMEVILKDPQLSAELDLLVKNRDEVGLGDFFSNQLGRMVSGQTVDEEAVLAAEVERLVQVGLAARDYRRTISWQGLVVLLGVTPRSNLPLWLVTRVGLAFIQPVLAAAFWGIDGVRIVYSAIDNVNQRRQGRREEAGARLEPEKVETGKERLERIRGQLPSERVRRFRDRIDQEVTRLTTPVRERVETVGDQAAFEVSRLLKRIPGVVQVFGAADWLANFANRWLGVDIGLTNERVVIAVNQQVGWLWWSLGRASRWYYERFLATIPPVETGPGIVQEEGGFAPKIQLWTDESLQQNAERITTELFEVAGAVGLERAELAGQTERAKEFLVDVPMISMITEEAVDAVIAGQSLKSAFLLAGGREVSIGHTSQLDKDRGLDHFVFGSWGTPFDFGGRYGEVMAVTHPRVITRTSSLVSKTDISGTTDEEYKTSIVRGSDYLEQMAVRAVIGYEDPAEFIGGETKPKLVISEDWREEFWSWRREAEVKVQGQIEAENVLAFVVRGSEEKEKLLEKLGKSKKQIPVYTQNELFGTDFPSEPNDLARMRWNFRRIVRGEPLLQSGEIELAHLNEIEEMIPEESVEEVVSDGQDDSFIGRLRLVVVNWSEFVWGLAGSVFQRYRTVISSKGKISVVSIDLATLEVWDLQQFFVTELKATSRSVFDRIQKGSLEAWYVEESGEPVLLVLRSRTSGLVTIKNRVGTAVSRKALDSVVTFLKNGYPDGLAMTKATGKQVGHVLLELGWQKNAEGRLVWQGRAASAWEIRTVINSVLSAGLSLILAGNILWHIFQPTGLLEAQLAARTIQKELAVEVVEVPVLKKEEATEEIVELVQDETIEAELETPPAPEVLEIFPEGQAQQEAIGELRQVDWGDGVADPHFYSTDGDPYDTIPDWVYDKILPKLDLDCQTTCSEAFHNLGVGGVIGGQIVYKDTYRPADLVDVSEEIKVASLDENDKIQSGGLPYLQAFIEELRANGYNNIIIRSAYRSYELQDQYYRQGKDTELVAPAGFSQHQSGLAFDIWEMDENFNLVKPLYNEEVLEIANKHGIVAPYSPDEDAEHYFILDVAYPGLTQIMKLQGIDPNSIENVNSVLLGMAQSYEYLSTKELTAVGKPESTADQLAGTTTVVVLDTRVPEEYKGNVNGDISGYASHPLQVGEGKLVWKQEEWLAVAPEDRFLPAGYTPNPETYTQIVNHYNIEDSRNLRYLANDNATFCNIWVGDVMAELGKPLPRWINGQKTYANMLSDWLADPNLGGAVGWREATAEEAQTVANQGMASLVVVKRQGEAGHMAPVIPETSTYQVQKDASGRVVDPVIANVGTTNGVGHLVSDHFRPTEQPKYYIHDGPTYEFVTSSEMASIKLGEGQQVIDLTEAISLLPGIARKGFFLPLFGGLATILSRLAMVRGVLGEVFLLVKVKKIEQEERLLEEGYIATIRNSLSSTFIDWRRTRSRTAYLRNSYNYQRQRFAPSSVAYIGSDKEELYKEYSQLARQNQPVRVFVNFWWQAIGSFSQALKTVPERINNIRSERIEDLIDTGRERERVGVGLPGRVGRIFQNFGRYFSEQFSFKQYDSLRLRWLLGPGVVVAYFNEVVLQQFFRIDLWQEVVARLPDFMVRFNPLANLSGMELSQFLARTALTWYGSLVTQSVVSFGISRLPDTGFLGQIKVILSRSERLVAIVVFGSALAFLTPLYQTLGAVPSMVWGYVVGGVLYGLGDVVDWFRDRGAGGQEELVRMMDEINGAVEGIYPGQVITVGEKHYKVTRVDSILKLEEVVPLYEERLSGSMGYPVSYLGKFSVGYDGESGKTYFLKDDGEEGVEIQESGLALTDGEVIFPKKEYRDVYFLKFTNELYNYRDRWFIRYREGGFFVDNEDKGQESSSLWMLNGQMQIGRSVEIKPGDKITSPSGETFIFSFDERGYSVETDPNVQEFLSDEENDYFAQKVQEYNSPELYSFIVEKLKEAGLPEPSRYNGLGLDTEQKIIKSGDIGFYDQPNDYFGEMFVEHRKESIIVRGAILEFLGRRDPRLQEIYRKYLRADVLGLIDRFDFGIKKLEQRGRELELTDAERDYLELIRKLKRMWEVVSEFSPSAESDIKAVLDSVDPLLYSQITQVLEELGRFNIDDPLVKSYITVPKSFGDYTITLPGLNQDARLFTLAKFADDALTRRLAPGDGLTKHQKLMSDFWKRVFEETGVFEPEWFEVFTYRGDEISFHPRAYARQESIMANAGGEYFVNEEMTEETFVHLLNHEATHPTVVQSASPRYSSKPELRQINPNPVQSEQRHNEIVVELLGQMAMEGRVDYPGKHDLTIYQAGVEELVKILREIDTNGGESRRGIRLLLQGVVDYNVGLVAYPLQHVYDFYASNLGDSKEFFDRLAPYEDSVYKFTSSLRRVEETNVLSLPQVIKNLVSFGGKSYGVRIEGGLLRLGEVGVRTESNVEEATERWLGEVGIDHGVFERMTDGQELFEFVSERLFDVGMRLSKPQLTLRAFTRVEGVSGQRVREFIKSLSKWREPLAGVFSSFAYRWFRNNGYEVVTRFDITNINGANAVATDQQRLMGDYLLRMVAGTVVAVLPNGYKLVRVSGDEFAVLAPVGSASVETQIQSALATAQSLYREGNRIVLRLVAVEFTDKLFPIEEDFEREVVTSGERRQKGGFDFEGAEAEYSERVEQLEQFHPEMIYFFNLMRGVGDLATRARLLVLLETMLYDDILQSRILEIEAACGCKLSIYKDRYDWVSGAHVHGENYRLLRVDFPGMLKRLNILGYEAGDDFLLDRFELLVTNLGRQGLTDIHLMRRGGEFYVAVPSDISIDLNELQQSVSTAFTYFNRAFTVMGVAAETSIDLVPAVEEGRALNQTNIERLNLTQDILAGKIWEGTAAALREMVGRGPSEEEWEFIESYLNPFDKRGILRLKRLGVGDEVIGRLQGFYQQTDAGYVVDSNQKEAARTEFIKLLTQKSTWLRWWEKVKEWWGREQRLNFIPPVFQQGIGRVEELVTGEKYLRVDRGKLNTSVEVIPESVRLLQEQLGISSDEGDRTAFSELDRQREAVGDKIQREEINSYDSVKPEPFHSENKKRYLEGRSRWQQIRDFLRKIQVSFQLWREGVQNSFQLVTLLDEVDSPSIGYGSHLRYEDLLGEVDRKVLTQPWLLKAVKRLQLLGVEQPYIAVLADPEIYPWIERLVAIPESTFDDFIDRWDKLPLFTQLRVITLRNLRRLIVEKDLEKPSVNADFVWLVTKAEIGLTDNEWETLASMQRAAQLNRLLSSQYSLRSAYSLYSFSQTLDDRLFLNDYAQLANDATLVLEEIARADLADEVKKAIGYRLDLSDYFSNRDASIASSIHTLAELFRAGFYLDADFNYENFYQISTATELIPLIRGVLQVADKPLTLSNYYRFSNFSLVDIFRAAADFSRLSPEAQERINEYLFQKISDQGLVPPGDVQDFLADNRNLADWMRYRVSEDAIEVMVALANRLKGVSLEQFATHTDHMRNVITVSQGSYSWFEQEQYRKDLSGFYPGWFVDAVEPLDLFDHYKRRGLRQFITWSETRANEYVTDVDTVSEQFISDVLNELSHSYDTDYINQLASLFITLRPFLPKSKLGTLALLIGGAAIDTKRVHQLVAQKEKILAVIGEDGSIDERLWQVMVEMDASVPFWFLALSSHYDFIAETWVTGPVYPIFYDLIEKDVDWQESWGWVNKLVVGDKYQAFGQLIREHYLSGNLLNKLSDQLIVEAVRKKVVGPNLLVEFADIRLEDQNLSAEERRYWQLISQLSYDVMKLKITYGSAWLDLISSFIENEEAIVGGDFTSLLPYATRQQWRTMFGDEVVTKLLQVLPEEGDERRNAFTHNEYDRMSALIRYLVDTKVIDRLDQRELSTLTEYIRMFGLSKASLLYYYFRHVYLFETGQISSLPQDIADSGITTVAEIKRRIDNLRQQIYSEASYVPPANMSFLELNILSVATGKSVHHFDQGLLSIDQIVNNYLSDLEMQSIVPLPHHYIASQIRVPKISVEATVLQSDAYELVRQEVLNSLSHTGDIGDLKDQITTVLQTKIEELTRAKQANIAAALFLQKQIDEYGAVLTQLGDVVSLDGLMKVLITVNFGKNSNEQTQLNSILRQIVIRKVLEKHQSPGHWDSLRALVEKDEMTIGSVTALDNLLKNHIKDHAINIQTGNSEEYWEQETFNTIVQNKKRNNLNDYVNPLIEEMKKLAATFEIKELEDSFAISLIPDRGFVGEMSAYLANVCYSKECPLLRGNPNVIPFKFVAESGGQKEFLGSTLVFEEYDAEGNRIMIIRAFDVPRDTEMAIGNFFELFVTHLEDIAKKRGVKEILVAGTTSTVSNYTLTTNYVLSRYGGETGSKVRPAHRFDFNGYDITNSLYLVRELPVSEDGLAVADFAQGVDEPTFIDRLVPLGGLGLADLAEFSLPAMVGVLAALYAGIPGLPITIMTLLRTVWTPTAVWKYVTDWWKGMFKPQSNLSQAAVIIQQESDFGVARWVDDAMNPETDCLGDTLQITWVGQAYAQEPETQTSGEGSTACPWWERRIAAVGNMAQRFLPFVVIVELTARYYKVIISVLWSPKIPQVEVTTDLFCEKEVFPSSVNAVLRKVGYNSFSSPLEYCDRGCIKGMCTAKVNDSCSTEGQVFMRDDGGCLFECKGGVVTKTSSCDHVSVDSFSNELFHEAYSLLNTLPQHLFTGMEVRMNIYNDFRGTIGEGSGGFFKVDFVAVDGSYVKEDYAFYDGYFRHAIIHEFFHAFVDEGMEWVSVPLFPQLSTSFSHAVGFVLGTSIPRGYKNLTGCRAVGFLKYSYNMQPVTGNESESSKVSCEEDFVDSAAWYVTNACELRTQSPERYVYFRDEVFTDPKTGEVTEYLPVGGCAN